MAGAHAPSAGQAQAPAHVHHCVLHAAKFCAEQDPTAHIDIRNQKAGVRCFCSPLLQPGSSAGDARCSVFVFALDATGSGDSGSTEASERRYFCLCEVCKQDGAFVARTGVAEELQTAEAGVLRWTPQQVLPPTAMLRISLLVHYGLISLA